MNAGHSYSEQLGDLVDDLKQSLVFLTRLPPDVVGADASARPDFTRAARVFPLAGALIGVAGGLALIVAALLGLPSLVSATFAIAATMILTGALHEDGLADVADSYGGATIEKKFAIMDDSRIGTYGAAALIVSMLLRVAALGAIAARGAFAAALALIAAEAVSRAGLVRMWHDLPAARSEGLAHDTGPPDHQAMLVALAIAAAIVAVTVLPALGWWPALAGSVLAAIAAYMFMRMTTEALGGRTGDTLGACQQIVLVAFLVGASAV